MEATAQATGATITADQVKDMLMKSKDEKAQALLRRWDSISDILLKTLLSVFYACVIVLTIILIAACL